MTIEIALRIQELRSGNVMHSWRRIAEIVCEEFPDLPVQDGWQTVDAAHGNQLYGKDLCQEAAAFLKVSPEDYDYYWETHPNERTPR